MNWEEGRDGGEKDREQTGMADRHVAGLYLPLYCLLFLSALVGWGLVCFLCLL